MKMYNETWFWTERIQKSVEKFKIMIKQKKEKKKGRCMDKKQKKLLRKFDDFPFFRFISKKAAAETKKNI